MLIRYKYVMFNSKKEISDLFGDSEAAAGLVVAVCATLFDNGIRVIPIGGLMRLLGVPNEKAKAHDDKAFKLTDDFYEQLEKMGFERIDESQLQLPTNKTLH